MADNVILRKNNHESSRKSVPLTPSNVMRAVSEVEDWWGEYGLGRQLSIPQSKLKEIRQTFPDEMDQKTQVVTYWINTDPVPGWRRLIWVLDSMRETKVADSIRPNAKPLADLSLTPDTLLHAVSTVTKFWGEDSLLHWLLVPLSVQGRIRASPSYSSEDERKMAGLLYNLQTVTGASWGRIASVLWYMEEHTALESVRPYLPHKHDPSLILSNMASALNSLPDTTWEGFGWMVDVPRSKLDKIRSQFNSDGERKEEVFRIFLTEHPCPTWEHVSDALYQLGYKGQQYHNVLKKVQSMFPTGRRHSRVTTTATAPRPSSTTAATAHSNQRPPSTRRQVSSSTPVPATSSATGRATLDIDDLFTVSSELLPVAHKWKRIGLALRLDPDLLERIRQKNYTDVQDYLSDVLTEWLKKAYNTVRFGDPSWKLLVEAVAHPAGGNDCALAEKIARKVEGERAMGQRKRKGRGMERQMADIKRRRK